MGIEFKEQSAIAPRGTSLEEFETYCGLAAEMQRSCLWIIGDLALRAEREHPEYHNQVWPVWVSPDLIARCKGVSAAYTPNERNIDANWTIHSFHAKNPQRVEIIKAIVESGKTTDEERKDRTKLPPDDPPAETQNEAASPAVTPETSPPAAEQKPVSNAWLLCVDISYYIRRLYTMEGVETAGKVFEWVINLRNRMVKDPLKNLSDFVVCFDSPNSRRKLLTEGWKTPYKSRSKKDPELTNQFQMIRALFERINVTCVDFDGEEADDIMASYAAQFDGKVSLMTSDADLRQCLSSRCNILLDTKWEQHPETAVWRHVDVWVSEKKHFEEGVAKYAYTKDSNVVGITPKQWPHFQAIAGDSTDDIDGCSGIAGKYACDLIKAHGTVQGVIAAAKDGTADLTAKKIQAVLDFEPFAETTLLLTTMRTDLPVPMVTKIDKTDIV